MIRPPMMKPPHTAQRVARARERWLVMKFPLLLMNLAQLSAVSCQLSALSSQIHPACRYQASVRRMPSRSVTAGA